MALSNLSSWPQEEAETSVIEFRGHIFAPQLSGALFWPKKQTLLVADLHLEKMASFARSGQLLPPYDTGATLARLAHDLEVTKAKRVICLGDSFHRDDGTRTLTPRDRDQLSAMVAQKEWIWLAGNHDPSAHAIGGVCKNEQTFGNITLSHQPECGRSGQIAGHLHPAARVLVKARSLLRPCFVCDDNLMILPAYGVSTGCLNILSPPFEGLFARDRLQVTMIGNTRLYSVSAKRLVEN